VPRYLRSDQTIVHVSIPGVPLDNESWDVMDGGDNDVQALKVYPGGSKPGVSLGGIPKRAPVTVERLWSDTMIGLFKQIDSVAGSASMTVTYANRNADGSVGSIIDTYTGTVGTVSRPKYKSGTSEEVFLKVMLDCDDPLT
jgi:hypothetical protein